ncbi:putative thiamine-phosphate pyrophosphorylase [Neorickettsia risticii str. Illinois]|uniref:Thiamine-phosphate pyrophosphorylase n=1 Tax=Neorickettsia risticii (strain Illinois) TaxID=434131 RepID=C6V488_NEORI|nr:thiamine phosphate synthase [Neorickettsia risticii]ACT69200.1 putative thiamine-phosphate pyrophosphorylase [Neorickettsia risticii str. Illinois]
MQLSKAFYILSPNRRITTAEYADLARLFKDFFIYVYAFQLRIKDRNLLEREIPRLSELCHEYKIPLIVNDFIDLALKFETDGVHIGVADNTLEQCQYLLPSGKIVGISCYNDIERAKKNLLADYVSFGCFFESRTKPNPPAKATLTILDKWKKIIPRISCVCIGGINEKNFAQLLRNGADIVAFSDYLWKGKSPYGKFAALVETSKHYGKLLYK